MTDRQPDPNADEFKCVGCGNIFDIEDSCKDDKKDELRCSVCYIRKNVQDDENGVDFKPLT